MSFPRKTHWTKNITPELDGKEVVLAGWVWDIRDIGNIKFILLRDREGLIQLTVKRGTVPEEVWSTASSLNREDAIVVKGIVKSSRIAKAGVEVFPSEVHIVARSKALPIDIWGSVETDLDTRLKYRSVDLKRPLNSLIFKAGSEVTRAVRDSLYNHGFIEVFTPKIIVTSTEGGAELFTVQYFERVAYLAQSPQLYKEELTASLERIFEIAPAYRAEKHNTNYHLNEFISVDIEEAFANYMDVMEILEDVIINVYDRVNKAFNDELNKYGIEIKNPRKPFRRITYDEALDMLGKRGLKIDWGEDVPKNGMEILSEEIGEPFFIIHFPTDLRAFYTKPLDSDPRISESFDLVIGGLEIASGSSRVHVKEQLTEALRKRGLNPESFENHLMIYDYGMPPHAGWGMGLYRLLMVLLRRDNIREVVLYPRDRFRLEP
ncbi:aspartate--tRNA(Asn) ligase [Vulcanisaeta souniana]|uniref:Aspartate--tRNA(Asp) ligase n=1 Tax=Vulcanisaeta souniana JCM 11219 TaxID=1293586 RepID=A0A830E7S7_9CREN|nr:aspartate--tRNA(Asn) ligase [Vulcanisaeta souniana]BDR93163.1 aspartate--tRNA(Asn) ligase [Vulcanisaeta souniana JCM 11219]GGI78148.1 aspartate--tRNA(Asn) ligase [Vulcanisaeta souniana JCM 11219]